MKRPLILALGVLALGTAGVMGVTAFAPHATQSTSTLAANAETRTFAIANMTCATCPITVRKAMSRVEGVQSVDVDFTAKTATVVFDPSVTNAEAIAAASTNAGYPAGPSA